MGVCIDDACWCCSRCAGSVPSRPAAVFRRVTLRWNGRRLPAWIATLALACTHKSPPRYVQISVGDHACARRSDGRVVCWGANRFGATGAREGDMEPAVVSFIRDATDVAAGHDVSCAVVGNGNVECWGFVWSADPRDRRQRIPVVHDAVRVLLAGRRACALAADGAAICWGPAEGAALVPREWPPAPDPAMRGAIEMSGREDLYCARIGDAFRCRRASSIDDDLDEVELIYLGVGLQLRALGVQAD